MTNHHGPSLLQAHESHSHPRLPASSISYSYDRSTAHLEAHRHAHHPHAHDHDSNTASTDESLPAPVSTFDSLVAEPHSDERASSDSSSPDAPSLAAAVDALAGRADDAASYVTQVVQTVSLIQVVDYSGSPISTSTHYADPNTVVVNASTGETVSQSGPAFTIAVNPSSSLPGLGSSSAFTPSTTASSRDTASTSSQPGSSAAIPTTSTPVGFPTLSDASNGTARGNATALSNAFNATVKSNLFTQPFNISTTLSNSRLSSASSSTSLSSSSSSSSPSSSSSSSSSSSPSSFSSSSSGYISTPTYNSPMPTVAGSAETSPSSTAAASDPLTPQQKQIVGGVVGSVAGVAFLALLVILALRYKKKRVAQSSPSNTETRGFAALPASGSDASNSMAERNGAASSVSAAFAALTNKRQSRGNGAGAPDALQVPPGGERGFYRVSGRKLASVLYSGGDGYTDPRESTMSRFSQSSEPFNPGEQPFSLGSPMRPVSGVPIMRSGPARTPVTEANPFADPNPSPPLPQYDSPPRRPGSNGSPRAPGSRFQESI